MYGKHPYFTTKRDDQFDAWREEIEALANENIVREGRRVLIDGTVEQYLIPAR